MTTVGPTSSPFPVDPVDEFLTIPRGPGRVDSDKKSSLERRKWQGLSCEKMSGQ